jgi:hypothetical protein
MEINALATGQKSNIQKISSCISRIIGLWLETEHGKHWAALARSFEVPTSMVLEGLHRTKVVKERSKEVTLTKKPKRPSKRIEVLSLEEANILIKLEKAFDDYSDYIKSLHESVPINKIVDVRKHIRELIAAMWLVVERVSAPLTKRRTAFTAGLSESEKKKININKAFVQSLENDFFSSVKADRALFYTISPQPLLIKALDRELLGELGKCEVNIHYILVPEGTNPLIASCFQSFGTKTATPVVERRPAGKNKKKRATKVEHFSDEDQRSDQEDPDRQLID